MPVNHRAMGETTGMWEGPEIERTQFYGLKTIFFSRFTALVKKGFLALREQDFEPVYDHVFIAPINPKFWEGSQGDFAELAEIIRYHLSHNKRVTVEVDAHAQGLSCFTELRRLHLGQFCLLLVVTLPEPERGGFSVKVAPPVVFEDREYEQGVMVVTSDQFMVNKTSWAEYSVDEDL
jgi:hypothetical protein